jgi:hypothetical protein
LTVENNRDQQVRVDDLAVEVVEDEATPGGSVAACPVGGASSEPFGLFVDLARDPPGLQFRENEGEEWGPLPGFELDPGEQDSFVIYVAGRSDRLVSWRLVADVRSEGRTSKLVLQDGKDPLRIAGTGGVPMVHLDRRGVGALPALTAVTNRTGSLPPHTGCSSRDRGRHAMARRPESERR